MERGAGAEGKIVRAQVARAQREKAGSRAKKIASGIEHGAWRGRRTFLNSPDKRFRFFPYGVGGAATPYGPLTNIFLNSANLCVLCGLCG